VLQALSDARVLTGFTANWWVARKVHRVVILDFWSEKARLEIQSPKRATPGTKKVLRRRFTH
jgi:hypothetical protein